MMAEKLFNSQFIRVFKASHNIQINDFFNSIGCPWFLYLPNHSIEDDDINSVCSQLPGGGIPLSICLIPGHLGNCSQLKCVYICGELEQKMGGKRAANPNYTTDISIGWRRWVKEKYQNDSHLRGFSPPWQSIMAAAEAQPTAGEAEGSSSDIQCDKLNLWRQGAGGDCGYKYMCKSIICHVIQTARTILEMIGEMNVLEETMTTGLKSSFGDQTIGNNY